VLESGATESRMVAVPSGLPPRRNVQEMNAARS
jgi:hypothetical protein